MAQFPFDPRNPYPMGYSPLTPEQAAQPAPTPAAAAARLGTPGYPQQTLANPGIYAPQSRAGIPPGIYNPGGQTPAMANAGAAFGMGPSVAPSGMGTLPGSPLGGAPGSPLDPAAMQFAMMRGAPAAPAAPRAPGGSAPRGRGGGSVSNAARTPPPSGDTGPAAGVPEPAIPEGQVGPTLTAPPPAVGAAAAMDAGDPDKGDFLDMQSAIADWQMGMGGTGQRMTDANRLQDTGALINRNAQIKGSHPVNQLTRALGGVGAGLASYKAGGERARIQETTDQLRNKARAELERIREKRRGGKKPTAGGESPLDRAFADSGDVSAAVPDEDDYFKANW